MIERTKMCGKHFFVPVCVCVWAIAVFLLILSFYVFAAVSVATTGIIWYSLTLSALHCKCTPWCGKHIEIVVAA